MTEEEIKERNEVNREMLEALIHLYVDRVVASIDTNHGTWKDRLVTTSQAEREFEENPIASAMVCAWIFAVIPDEFDPGTDKEDLNMFSDFCASLGYCLIDHMVAGLVTAHNLAISEES